MVLAAEFFRITIALVVSLGVAIVVGALGYYVRELKRKVDTLEGILEDVGSTEYLRWALEQTDEFQQELGTPEDGNAPQRRHLWVVPAVALGWVADRLSRQPLATAVAAATTAVVASLATAPHDGGGGGIGGPPPAAAEAPPSSVPLELTQRGGSAGAVPTTTSPSTTTTTTLINEAEAEVASEPAPTTSSTSPPETSTTLPPETTTTTSKAQGPPVTLPPPAQADQGESLAELSVLGLIDVCLASPSTLGLP